MNVESDDISALRNLGKVSLTWLRESGVATKSQLQLLGPVVAFQIVRERIPSANLNLLWALAAGLDNQDWRALSKERKTQLLAELRRLTNESDD